MITIRMADGKKYGVTIGDYKGLIEEICNGSTPLTDFVFLDVVDIPTEKTQPVVLNLRQVVAFEGDPEDRCEMWKGIV